MLLSVGIVVSLVNHVDAAVLADQFVYPLQPPLPVWPSARAPRPLLMIDAVISQAVEL